MARVALLLLLLGCAHGRPDWLTRGSGTEGRTMRGVGVSGGLANPEMRARTAEARARGKLGQLISAFAGDVERDCTQEWRPRVAHLALPALGLIEIRDRWTDGEDSAALAAVDLDAILDAWGAPPAARACALQGWQKLSDMPR